MTLDIVIPTVTLNNGVEMPQFGLGTLANLREEETVRIMMAALEAGYRSFDTATRYKNERGIGKALKRFGVSRSDIFVTSKVWNADHGRDATLRAFDTSLAELGFDYVDLFLIHFPAPMVGLYVETWLTLEEIYREGRARAIGVANFEIPHLSDILDAGSIVPTVNQVELHPRLQQRSIRAFNERQAIKTEAWSPLAMGVAVREPFLSTIAAQHDASTAQIILRWHLQRGTIVIPRSTNAARIRENLESISIHPLDDQEMASIDALDSDARIGPHPDDWFDGNHDYPATIRRYEQTMQGG